MIKYATYLATITLLLMATAVRPAAAGTVYVSTSDGSFGTLDTATWAFSSLATGTNTYNALALVNGALYGDTGTEIYSLDQTTGAAQALGRDPLDYSFSGYQVGNTLYMSGWIGGGPSDFYLATDNLTSGGGTNLGNILDYSHCNGNGVEAIGGMGSTLYAISAVDPIGAGGGCPLSSPTFAEALYTVDPTTLAMTQVGLTGLAINTLGGMFTADNTLYAWAQGTSGDTIYSINSATGAATQVATISQTLTGATLDTLSGGSATPEPASIGLGLVGLSLILRMKRRRARV